MKEFISKGGRRKRSSLSTIVKSRNKYLKEIRQLRKTIPNWDNFFAEENDEDSAAGWVRLDVLGGPLCKKYAWAIPNQRALNIIANFSPVVEIGAGKGYWASLLLEMGVDIECYDKKGNKKGNWTEVKVGGPKVLAEKGMSKKTLFLCYPDDSNNMAVKCLDHFSGEYIIHVGELITTGTLSGGEQAPFGRTTGSDFSVALAESFHCLLTASIPRFPFSKDCITVWKRTQFAPGKSVVLAENHSEDNDNDNGNDNGDEEEDCWASIPPEEVLPEDRAAPCLAHLLH